MLAIAVLAVFAVGVEEAPAQDEPFTPRIVIFTYPTSTLGMLGAGALTGNQSGPTLYATLGTSVRLSERVALDVELGVGELVGGAQSGWMVSTGFGPSLQLTGDEPFSGAFLSMRFVFQAVKPAVNAILTDGDSNHGPIDLGPGISRAFMGEVDVGYHFRYGRVYFAPIIGVGVGYAYDYVDSTHLGLLSPFTPASGPTFRPQQIVWSLNLNLARLGGAL